jgi:hypothetical protein
MCLCPCDRCAAGPDPKPAGGDHGIGARWKLSQRCHSQKRKKFF